MKKYIKNKKGQSLVEVVVALSLLTIALTGVVTLAANTVGLMMSSKFRTEATALAQDKLEELKGTRENECSGIVLGSSGPEDIDIYQRTTSIAADSSFTGAVRITVTVTWGARGGGSITVIQLMSKNI